MMDASGTLRGNRISDASRGILIVGGGDVKMIDNVLERSAVLRKASGGRSRRLRPCGANEDCVPTAQ